MLEADLNSTKGLVRIDLWERVVDASDITESRTQGIWETQVISCLIEEEVLYLKDLVRVCFMCSLIVSNSDTSFYFSDREEEQGLLKVWEKMDGVQKFFRPVQNKSLPNLSNVSYSNK